ncbi:hypothetical protein, partial [uncultured Desulfovibrio sp.]|uniref:hypothetical protein n=1 Tax=uncultured Desulfovibrio sp. TaxID=167968 RepID=UPI0026395A40
SMNHRPLSASPLFLSGAVQVYAPFPNPCQQLFFRFAKFFFAALEKFLLSRGKCKIAALPSTVNLFFTIFFAQ